MHVHRLPKELKNRNPSHTASFLLVACLLALIGAQRRECIPFLQSFDPFTSTAIPKPLPLPSLGHAPPLLLLKSVTCTHNATPTPEVIPPLLYYNPSRRISDRPLLFSLEVVVAVDVVERRVAPLAHHAEELLLVCMELN